MLTVSNTFKEMIDAPERIIRGAVKVQLVNNNSVTVSVPTGSTNGAALVDGVFDLYDFAMKGSITIGKEQQWEGASVSNASGVLSTPEVITLTYSNPIEVECFWLAARRGNYPVDFSYEVTDSAGVKLSGTMSNNDMFKKTINLGKAVNVKSIKVTITKINAPDTRAALLELGIPLKLIFMDQSLADMQILEQASAEARNPVGSISSNELTTTLVNEDGWLSLESENNPIRNLLRPGIELVAHVGVQINDIEAEMVPMGTYYLLTWDAPSDILEVAVMAWDRLSKILDLPVPAILPQKGKTLYQLFEILFRAMGLGPNDYIIDESLSRVVPVGWFFGATFRECLQSLCDSSPAMVVASRDNKIKVVDLLTSDAPVAQLKASEQLNTFSNPQVFSDTYSKVSFQYANAGLGDVEEIAFLENITIPMGISNIDSILFNSPIGNISYVTISNSKVTVEDIIFGANSATIKVSSTNTSNVVCDVIVYGQPMENTYQVVERQDDLLFAQWPDRVLQMQLEYVQDNVSAQKYANAMMNFVKDPRATAFATSRGNPALETLDVVTVPSDPSINHFADLNLLITSQKFIFDGGLECELNFRKTL